MAQRMARTLKDCVDPGSAFLRSVCYASDPQISALDIEEFDIAAREIEIIRRRAASRLSWGERAAGLLFIPLGLPLIGIASLASDEAEAASRLGFVEKLDQGWGFLPLAIMGAGILIGSAIAIYLAATSGGKK